MNIRLHIDRLVLDGLPFGAADGRLVQAALEAELTALLATGAFAGAVGQGFALPGVRVDPVSLARDATPHEVGTQVAQALHQGISR